MDLDPVVAILGELLSREQRALAPRLFESTVFVSRLALADSELAHRIARSNRSAQEELAGLIHSLGGPPTPREVDAATADLHYQEIRCVWPRLIKDHDSLIAVYHVAVSRLSDEPHSQRVVSSILARHDEEAQRLHELRRDQSSALSA